MTRSINSNVGVYGTFGTASDGAHLRWIDNDVIQGTINNRVYAHVRHTDPYTYTVPITAADCSGFSISANVDTMPIVDPPLTQYAWPVDVPNDGAAYWGGFYRNNPDKFVEQYFHTDVARIEDIRITIPIKKAHESKEEHMEVSEDLADFLNNL